MAKFEPSTDLPLLAVNPDLGYPLLGWKIVLMADQNRYDLFQKALADERHERRLTQADLATRLGKPQSYVSKYESGERRLDVVEFLEVCEALSTNPYTVLKKVQPQSD